MKPPELFIEQKLSERLQAGTYRTLKNTALPVDFCSNDYLGFARSAVLKDKIAREVLGVISNGSTGSRLLSGNQVYTEELEQQIAALHECKAALIFNSGYDANLGLFSSIAQRGDTIITDELIHASIIDGARLSHANRYTFKHNDLDSLESKLKNAKGNCFVAVESVYSMDGDTPPLLPVAKLVAQYNGHFIIDEAHALGLYGLGLIEGDLKDLVFARIVTFGKAMGGHGAAVLGSNLLRSYLINFARCFIYTTAASFHQMAGIKMAYELLQESTGEVAALKANINLFKQRINPHTTYPLISSNSAIQCLVLNSNEKAKELAAQLQSAGLDVRPILSPTVPQGSERIRICLHAFNTESEIILLTDLINHYTNET